MYTKTWTEQTHSSGIFTHRDKEDGAPNWESVVSTPIAFVTDRVITKSGTSVPGWRQIIRDGGNANSAYTLTATRFSSLERGSVAVGYTNPGVSVVRDEFEGVASAPALPAFSSVPVSVSNKALARILGKIRAEYEHSNVLPALGELRSTVSQFGAPFSALLSLCNRRLNRLALEERGLKGSVVFKRVAWARIVASTYLEFQFGLRPIISETQAIAEALARWNAEKEGDLPRPTSNLLTASAKLTTNSQFLVDGEIYPFPGSSILGFQESRNQTNDYGTRYVVKLKNSLQAQFGSNDRLLQLLGFNNPLNFIPTVWEVLPWSWLIDYFLNVQQIIEAGVTVTSNVDWIVRTDRVHSKSLVNFFPVKPDLVAGQFPVRWESAPSHLGRYTSEYTALTRSLPETLGLPIPTVSYPNSVEKIANATAALFARRAHSHPLWL